MIKKNWYAGAEEKPSGDLSTSTPGHNCVVCSLTEEKVNLAEIYPQPDQL